MHFVRVEMVGKGNVLEGKFDTVLLKIYGFHDVL